MESTAKEDHNLPPVMHIMNVPEKIELTATGGYPSSQSSSERQDTRYRSMTVPDKITLESSDKEQGGRRDEERGNMEEGRGEGGMQGTPPSGGVGRHFQQSQ